MEAAESQTAYVVVFLYYAIFFEIFSFYKPLYTESANKNCATRYPKAKDKKAITGIVPLLVFLHIAKTIKSKG